jgi:hypothetical protein
MAYARLEYCLSGGGSELAFLQLHSVLVPLPSEARRALPCLGPFGGAGHVHAREDRYWA